LFNQNAMTEKDAILDEHWPDPLVPPAVIMSTVPWIRPPSAALLAFAPPRLVDVATLVTSQENACRYCYGALRAAMRLSGYSDARIRDLERDVQLADGLTREVVSLSRKLARSTPRPVKEELAALQRLGLDYKAAAEIVYAVAYTCYCNRIGTILALPPDVKFERAVERPISRLMLYFAYRFSPNRTRRVGPSTPVQAEGLLAPLVRALPEAPLAAWFAGLATACFSAPAISRRTKLLMLAVIARTLGCRFCEQAACTDVMGQGLDADGFTRILDSLSGVNPEEARLLDWARETVRYETGNIQKRTRALAAAVSTEVLLEAVATAAFSNTAVRLAMLIE
jgi:alkylhydroperoxidase family enzyme